MVQLFPLDMQCLFLNELEITSLEVKGREGAAGGTQPARGGIDGGGGRASEQDFLPGTCQSE